jgi:hypothetical protein
MRPQKCPLQDKRPGLAASLLGATERSFGFVAELKASGAMDAEAAECD